MSTRLYMDEHIPGAITRGLRNRGADVLTVQEDGMDQSPDHLVLDRAAELGRLVVTSDSDFKVEAARRQRALIHFAGVFFVDLNSLTIGQCIDDLELVCVAGKPEEFVDRLEYLPI